MAVAYLDDARPAWLCIDSPSWRGLGLGEREVGGRRPRDLGPVPPRKPAKRKIREPRRAGRVG